jgi:MraZ protein
VFELFVGQHENKIDAKGRMSIPADFRKVLDGGDADREAGSFPRLHLVIGDHRRDYVEGMTMARIGAIRRQILALPPMDKRRRDMEKFYYIRSVQLAVDETGRIVVPPVIRQKLGLEGSAVVLGRGESLEIWRPETYEASEEDMAADPDIGFDPDADPMTYLTSELGSM